MVVAYTLTIPGWVFWPVLVFLSIRGAVFVCIDVLRLIRWLRWRHA